MVLRYELPPNYSLVRNVIVDRALQRRVLDVEVRAVAEPEYVRPEPAMIPDVRAASLLVPVPLGVAEISFIPTATGMGLAALSAHVFFMWCVSFKVRPTAASLAQLVAIPGVHLPWDKLGPTADGEFSILGLRDAALHTSGCQGFTLDRATQQFFFLGPALPGRLTDFYVSPAIYESLARYAVPYPFGKDLKPYVLYRCRKATVDGRRVTSICLVTGPASIVFFCAQVDSVERVVEPEELTAHLQRLMQDLGVPELADGL